MHAAMYALYAEHSTAQHARCWFFGSVEGSWGFGEAEGWLCCARGGLSEYMDKQDVGGPWRWTQIGCCQHRCAATQQAGLMSVIVSLFCHVLNKSFSEHVVSICFCR
jgi:hypothetical protein